MCGAHPGFGLLDSRLVARSVGHGRTGFFASVVLWGLVSGACSSTSSKEVTSSECVAGDQEPCRCPGGRDGVQVCKADGKGFSPCQCGALDGGAGTAGGSGAGGGSGAVGGGGGVDGSAAAGGTAGSGGVAGGGGGQAGTAGSGGSAGTNRDGLLGSPCKADVDCKGGLSCVVNLLNQFFNPRGDLLEALYVGRRVPVDGMRDSQSKRHFRILRRALHDRSVRRQYVRIRTSVTAGRTSPARRGGRAATCLPPLQRERGLFGGTAVQSPQRLLRA